MLLLSLILCAGTAQLPPEDIHQRFMDVACVESQENWVIDSLPKTSVYRSLDNRFSTVEARYIRMLACNHYECTEVAGEEIGRLGDKGLPLLVWGCRSVDKNIRNRSHVIRNKLFHTVTCPTCKGKKSSFFRYPMYDSQGATIVGERVIREKCATCWGYGNFVMGQPTNTDDIE